MALAVHSAPNSSLTEIPVAAIVPSIDRPRVPVESLDQFGVVTLVKLGVEALLRDALQRPDWPTGRARLAWWLETGEAAAGREGEPAPAVRACRVCGCTDGDACVDGETGVPCHWVEQDLCSSCADGEEGGDGE